MKYNLYVLTMVILLAGLFYTKQSYADATYFLVRHAEKMQDGSNDPHLTEQGKFRAGNLALQLSSAQITKIYSTDYNRTTETVTPLSKLINIPVELYDPRKLNEFAEKLKSEQGNIVIVGHSNTTPTLVYLLSQISVDDIDDSEYDNLYQVFKINNQTRLSQSHTFPIDPLSTGKGLSVDSKRFKSGSATFNMLLNGDVVGQSIHTLSMKNNTIYLHENTHIEKMGIDADIHAVAHKETLHPISMKMDGVMGSAVDINLKWNGDHVKGHSHMARAIHHPQGRLTIDQELPAHSYERTSLIMLAHLLSINKDHKHIVKWFNGYNGFSRDITITYVGEEKIIVPAGEFETYKLLYQGGAPSQLFYISKTEYPEIVKIEIPTMPWTYELIKSR